MFGHVFMKYAKTIDFCKTVTKFCPDVTYKCADDYDFKSEKWFISCSHGNLMFPPEEDFGKVWVYISLNKQTLFPIGTMTLVM